MYSQLRPFFVSLRGGLNSRIALDLDLSKS